VSTQESTIKLSRFDLLVLSVLILLVILVGGVALVGTLNTDNLQVAYMVQGGGNVADIWLADLDSPENARQITDSEIGVDSFTVSPDGNSIVYADRHFETGAIELRRLDLRNNTTTTLTNCIETRSVCHAPVYSPTGEMIAYERRNVFQQDNTVARQERMWILDMTTPTSEATLPETYPLIPEPDILGHSAVWSLDGNSLAFYDNNNAGVVVYNFDAAAREDNTAVSFIVTGIGTNGALSPDGTQFVFPELLFDDQQARAYLQVADLVTLQYQVLTAPEENANDTAVVWHPDGRHIGISRRFLGGDRATPGQQIFLLDTADGSLDPLVFDSDYFHGVFSWSPDGDLLVLQRYETDTRTQLATGGIVTEIWVYDMDSRALTRIAEDAYQPLFVP